MISHSTLTPLSMSGFRHLLPVLILVFVKQLLCSLKFMNIEALGPQKIIFTII